MRIRLFWRLIFLSVTAGTFLFYQHTQAPLTYNFAPEFDGNDYTHIYHHFVFDDEYQVSFPFNGRILVPWLASLINSGNIVQDFEWINLVFSLASVAMLFLLWRQLGFELKWFIAGFCWLLFHWTGMIRLNAFDPITVDVPLYFFQALFIWLVLKRKFLHLLWLAPIAVLQKESFVALPILLLLYGWWHNRKTEEGFYNLSILGIVVVLVLAAKLLVQFYFPPMEEGKGALITVAYHAKQALFHPFEIVRWLAAMSMAFGPALWLAFRHYGKTYRYDNTRNLLLMFSGLYLAFGILAGGDMTRIIYLGFPFIATWIMYELKEIKIRKLVVLGLLSLPLMVLYKTIPDPAFQWEAWQGWYPEFAPTSVVLVLLFYTLIAFGISSLKKGNP